jgi:glycerol-3-phosphate dehydrogenase
VFYDAQIYNPTRLALSFLRSALEAGAQAANYLETTHFLVRHGRVLGVRARDVVSGDDVEVRGRLVINAAGPWAESLLATLPGALPRERSVFSRDACLIVGRRLTPDCALALPGTTSDPDALLSRGTRHLFVVPWRRYTLVGVWHVVHRGAPDDFTVKPEEIAGFVREINGICPGLQFGVGDVSKWNAGLVLFGRNEPGARDLRYGHRSRIIDHAAAHGLHGLLTVIGVRYTTARGVARRVIDQAFRRMGKTPPPSRTESAPIFGGDFETFEHLESEARSGAASELPPDARTALLHNYGSRYGDVLQYAIGDPSLAQPLRPFTTLRAEVLHAVHREMALTLEDVVSRRTDLATGEYPGDGNLRICARLMARELQWNEERIEGEIQSVRASFHDLGAGVRSGNGRS